MQQKYSVSFKKHIVYSKNAALAPGVCPLCNMTRIIANSCIAVSHSSKSIFSQITVNVNQSSCSYVYCNFLTSLINNYNFQDVDADALLPDRMEELSKETDKIFDYVEEMNGRFARTAARSCLDLKMEYPTAPDGM